MDFLRINHLPRFIHKLHHIEITFPGNDLRIPQHLISTIMLPYTPDKIRCMDTLPLIALQDSLSQTGFIHRKGDNLPPLCRIDRMPAFPTIRINGIHCHLILLFGIDSIYLHIARNSFTGMIPLLKHISLHLRRIRRLNTPACLTISHIHHFPHYEESDGTGILQLLRYKLIAADGTGLIQRCHEFMRVTVKVLLPRTGNHKTLTIQMLLRRIGRKIIVEIRLPVYVQILTCGQITGRRPIRQRSVILPRFPCFHINIAKADPMESMLSEHLQAAPYPQGSHLNTAIQVGIIIEKIIPDLPHTVREHKLILLQFHRTKQRFPQKLHLIPKFQFPHDAPKKGCVIRTLQLNRRTDRMIGKPVHIPVVKSPFSNIRHVLPKLHMHKTVKRLLRGKKGIIPHRNIQYQIDILHKLYIGKQKRLDTLHLIPNDKLPYLRTLEHPVCGCRSPVHRIRFIFQAAYLIVSKGRQPHILHILRDGKLHRTAVIILCVPYALKTGRPDAGC